MQYSMLSFDMIHIFQHPYTTLHFMFAWIFYFYHILQSPWLWHCAVW